MKAINIDLAVVLVVRFSPMSFTFLTSSELIWYLITLFTPQAVASHVEETFLVKLEGYQFPQYLPQSRTPTIITEIKGLLEESG